MAGYNILKSMESSQAPVYVVVKSFAASMAACITTCADKSFAYPNAVILHHQISSGSFGNLTIQRENLAEIEEWWRRLAEPVAKKMGALHRGLHQAHVPGSQQRRLVGIRRQGGRTEMGRSRGQRDPRNRPGEKPRCRPSAPPSARSPGMPSATSADRHWNHPSPASRRCPKRSTTKARPYMRLPRLAPKDFYYLYNPDGYYRL